MTKRLPAHCRILLFAFCCLPEMDGKSLLLRALCTLEMGPRGYGAGIDLKASPRTSLPGTQLPKEGSNQPHKPVMKPMNESKHHECSGSTRTFMVTSSSLTGRKACSTKGSPSWNWRPSRLTWLKRSEGLGGGAYKHHFTEEHSHQPDICPNPQMSVVLTPPQGSISL